VRIHFNNIDGALKIFIALSDRTRLEILSHLLKAGPQGMTAADISRLTDKKIPSTLHQLEILHDANLIEDAMFHVSSLNREIKHWFVPAERRRILIDFSLPSLIEANMLNFSQRIAIINSYRDANSQGSLLSLTDVVQILKMYFITRKEGDPLLTEEGIYDALAVDVFNRFRTADPPLIDVVLFDELNYFSAQVGEKVREVLIKNDRMVQEVYQGRQVYRFIIF
jgi:DNA-binding transcriptional ArsR family regulator